MTFEKYWRKFIKDNPFWEDFHPGFYFIFKHVWDTAIKSVEEK